MTAIPYEMMLGRIAAIGPGGSTRAQLIEGPAPYVAVDRLQEAVRRGQCFSAYDTLHEKLYFKSEADRDEFNRTKGTERRLLNPFISRVIKTLEAAGAAGISRSEMIGNARKREYERAIIYLYAEGLMHSYSTGPHRRHFGRVEWRDDYMALRKREAAKKMLELHRRYRAAKAAARPPKVKAERKQAAPKKPKKPNQTLAKKAKQIERSAKPWAPPLPKIERPIIIPAGLKIQRLPSPPLDRWNVTTAPKIITAVDCREWAKAATC